MNILLIVISILGVTSIAGYFLFRESKAAAGLFSATCFGIAAFSIFGFFASFEPSVNGSNLGFKIGYAGIFLTALFGMFRAGRRLVAPAA